MCIVKFCLSKPQFAVKVTKASVALKNTMSVTYWRHRADFYPENLYKEDGISVGAKILFLPWGPETVQTGPAGGRNKHTWMTSFKQLVKPPKWLIVRCISTLLLSQTDLLQQVDGVPAAHHLGGEGGGGGGAPVLLNLLQELGHWHALRHGAPQPGTHPDRPGQDRNGLTESGTDGWIQTKDRANRRNPAAAFPTGG